MPIHAYELVITLGKYLQQQSIAFTLHACSTASWTSYHPWEILAAAEYSIYTSCM